MRPIRDFRGYDRKELRWIGVGVEFCVVILFFCFIGYLVDLWLERENPEFMIVGFFVGFVLMFYWLFKSTKDLRK
jgi:F0F1-type ATP synthase assembly protein I